MCTAVTRQNTTANGSHASHGHSKTAFQPSVFLIGIRRLQVTTGLLPLNRCQAQSQSPEHTTLVYLVQHPQRNSSPRCQDCELKCDDVNIHAIRKMYNTHITIHYGFYASELFHIRRLKSSGMQNHVAWAALRSFATSAGRNCLLFIQYSGVHTRAFTTRTEAAG
jgi:hypothetical protein